MTRFKKRTLDKFLAPYVSNFHSAEIPDLSDDSSSWLSKYFLNSVLRGSYANPFRQYVFNFLRRVEGAHVAHQCARSATAIFLNGSRQSMSRYMEAIFHWEAFLAQSWMAYALTENLNGTPPFRKGDGSVEERVNLLYNRSKHSDTAYAIILRSPALTPVGRSNLANNLLAALLPMRPFSLFINLCRGITSVSPSTPLTA